MEKREYITPSINSVSMDMQSFLAGSMDEDGKTVTITPEGTQNAWAAHMPTSREYFDSWEYGDADADNE